MNESKFIGLTGGIGSGKSKVSRFWASYGAVQLIDIDQICRELVEVEEPGWFALKQNLADTFFKRNGDLDRQALRSAIFNNDALRNQVNQLIHPLALDQLKSRTAAIGHPVLVEVPLLFEAGWEKYFTSIVVVYADQQTCCRRIAARDGVSPQEAARALAAQMDIWDKAMRADHVVDNRYGWLYTRMQVVHLATMITAFG